MRANVCIKETVIRTSDGATRFLITDPESWQCVPFSSREYRDSAFNECEDFYELSENYSTRERSGYVLCVPTPV